MITVFTPTYNRAHTVQRVWESLLAQTYTDFEWVVIDDGSTDEIENVIEQYRSQAFFPIIFHKFDVNRGKHIATNKALELATRPFFVVADSDDAFTPDALAFFMEGWESIPIDERDNYCGIRACCNNQFGTRVSDTLPYEPLDVSMSEAFYVHKFRKESWCMVITNIHKNFLFDENHKGYFPEGIIWSSMSKKYKLRFFNKATRVYYVGVESNSIMTGNGGYKHKISRNIILGRYLFQNEFKYITNDFKYFLKAAIVYSCYSFLNKSYITELRTIKNWIAKFVFLLGSTFGYLYHLKLKIENGN